MPSTPLTPPAINAATKRAAADGKTIVYEDNFGIWKLDVASGK